MGRVAALTWPAACYQLGLQLPAVASSKVFLGLLVQVS